MAQPTALLILPTREPTGEKTDAAQAAAQLLGEAPRELTFGEQLRYVASREPTPSFDVDDPAGGDQTDYDACAARLWKMALAFARLAEAG